MQRDEVKQIVMGIISAYLIYTGVRLVSDYDPSKKVIYLIAGILFIAFGAFALIMYVRRFLAARRERIEHEAAQEEAIRERQRDDESKAVEEMTGEVQTDLQVAQDQADDN